MTRLMWFRTDLRVLDNPALMHSRRDDEEGGDQEDADDFHGGGDHEGDQEHESDADRPHGNALCPGQRPHREEQSRGTFGPRRVAHFQRRRRCAMPSDVDGLKLATREVGSGISCPRPA